jgi:hypothetical protein
MAAYITGDSVWLGLKTVPHFTTLHKAASRIDMNLLHVMIDRFGGSRTHLAGAWMPHGF